MAKNSIITKKPIEAFTINTNHTLLSSQVFLFITNLSHSPSRLILKPKSHKHTDLDHLATSTREKCSSLVRSCYVPSSTICSNTKVEDGFDFRGGGGERRPWPKHVPSKRHGGRSCTTVSSEPFHLKSNLKNKTEADKGIEQRKVTWPDIAHGKDIAHILEFELSASEDGEHTSKYKRKHCGVCIIQ